ncbi:hypothetical protein SLA2020_222470 [Shorea laevis]
MSCTTNSFPIKVAIYHPKTKPKSAKKKHYIPTLCSSSSSQQNPLLSNFKTLKAAMKISIPTIPPSFFSAIASVPHFTDIIDPPVHPSVDPQHVFTGNFAPVDELNPTECPVIEGKIPLSLNGVYIRNGPNPRHKPLRALHFWEADGMLHSLKFSNGCATYCSRYVNTYKYKLEEEAASPVIPNFLSGFYGLLDAFRLFAFLLKIMAGQINLMNGFGVANTSLAFIGNKLLALYEADLPYEIKLTEEGDIETLGRWNIDRMLFASFTAHPKFDMETKETFAFRYGRVFAPWLYFLRFDENGVKQKEVPILSIKKTCFIHDFAITRRYAIFQETQLVLSPFKVVMGGGQLVDYDPKHTPRIGIIPRYATSDSEMKWFHVPGLNVLHAVNAWENDDDDEEIVLVAPNFITIENMHDKRLKSSVEKISINMKTGKVVRSILSRKNLEFGTINTSYIGKKNRYAYFGVVDEVAKFSGIVKLDIETGKEVGRRFYGKSCFGGEPFFVAKEAEHVESDEDDGYVMSFVHDEKTGESKFLVMDAKSPELSVMAVIKLPRRVPYGFHGLFLTKEKYIHL